MKCNDATTHLGVALGGKVYSLRPSEKNGRNVQLAKNGDKPKAIFGIVRIRA